MKVVNLVQRTVAWPLTPGKESYLSGVIAAVMEVIGVAIGMNVARGVVADLAAETW